VGYEYKTFCVPSENRIPWYAWPGPFVNEYLNMSHCELVNKDFTFYRRSAGGSFFYTM
jgi:hypothetical protein